jgi:DNA replication protein DnaC
MSITQSLQLAQEMKLHGIYESLELRLAQFASNPSEPSDLIRLLLEDENISRGNKKTSRLIARARFRRNCQLEDWDQSFERGISKVQLSEISMLGFVKNSENLLLVGGTGSGKTHLAISLGHRLCAKGISVGFYSMNLLFEELSAQKAAGKYLSFIHALAKLNVLIFDDFGLRSYDHEEAMALMDILEERYRKGCVILTTQVKSEGWLTLFEDKVTAEAIVDRLRHPATLIQLNGGSYRGKNIKNGGDKHNNSATSKQ